MHTLTKTTIRLLLKPRGGSSHKGDHGHALIIAGNKGKMGAAVIASKACLRTGVGLLTVNVPEEERTILQTSVPEAMLVMRENILFVPGHYSALGIGPGLGTEKNSEKLLSDVLTQKFVPLVLDADALNILAGNRAIFNKVRKGAILTPHAAEFDRLFGPHKNTEARIKTAVRKAKELGCVIVLKGSKTLVTSEGVSFFNTSGNAGLAKGGSGDALTGMITAFLAQGYSPFDSTKLGVYLHGLAADIALKKQSTESMLITDVIECLGDAFRHLWK